MKSGRTRLSALILGTVLFALPFPSPCSTFDPSFRFRTVETEHFSIHFHQGLGSVAETFADMAEEVHRRMVPLFL